MRFFHHSSVGLRLALTLGLILMVMLAVSYVWLEKQNREMLATEEAQRAELTAQSLVASLKSIMLAGRGDIAHDWMHRIASLPEVKDAKVFRVDGTEAFVDQKTISQVNAFLGEKHFHRGSAGRPPINVPDALRPAFADVANLRIGQAKVKDKQHGELALLYPITMDQACLHCHGYSDNPLRGVLMLNISTARSDTALAHVWRQVAIFFAAIVCLVSIGVWLSVRRQLLNPLLQLAGAALSIRSGDLSRRVHLNRKDELGEVAGTFNELVDHLLDDVEREQGLRHRQEALTEAVLSLAEKSASDEVLRHVGELAMEITGARYAMIGYVDSRNERHFIPLGMDSEAVAGIGHMPEGKGLLGLLWNKRQIVRVADITAHATRVGFPSGHPPMTSMLGAPILFGEQMLGALYLTDKQGGGGFTEDDETSVRVLAAACAVALSNSRYMESLNTANRVLEQRVEERTSELSEANQRLRSREVELELINEDLVRANDAKNQFLANTSHELRTPLNAIIGFSELLGHERIGDLNDKQKRYTEHIYTSGKRLLGIINDLLDISKIEAGMMQIDERDCSLAEVVRQATAEMQPLAEIKQLAMRLEEEGDVERMVQLDCGKLHQILVNLIGNAIKFTDQGEVTIRSALLEPTSTQPMRISVSVSDSGIGIDSKDIERIFEPFVQAEGGLNRRYGGTGLGLALTRRQVNLLGGSMEVESRPGDGSTFSVMLPVQQVGQTRPDMAGEAGGGGGAMVEEAQPAQEVRPRILVADADAERAQAVIRLLGQEGYDGILADLDHLPEQTADVQPFLAMLGLSGDGKGFLRGLQQIRGSAALGALPVILVGGTADELEFSMGPLGMLHAGNIEETDLFDAISRYGRLGPGPVTKPKILVIDDDESVRDFLRETLVMEGYTVLLASNGEDGVRAAIEREPDLIILDLMMSGTSGFEVVSRLRQHPTAADIPIMIYTAKDLTREESLRLGREVEHVLLKGLTGRAEILRHIQKLELTYPLQAHLIDSASSCFNLRYFRCRLEQEIANAVRHAMPFSLIGWQVDEYHEYMQTHGERWAVVALKEIVQMAKSATRQEDVLARIDVDRFALFLPNIYPEGANRVAEKIRLRLRNLPFPLPQEEVGRLTGSFGAVHFGEDGTDTDSLMRELSRRIHEAHRAGGDQACLRGEPLRFRDRLEDSSF